MCCTCIAQFNLAYVTSFDVENKPLPDNQLTLMAFCSCGYANHVNAFA